MEMVGLPARLATGDKVLGNNAEFRTGLGVAYQFDDGWRLGADFHHISNAGLGKKNPGVEIAALTLAVPLLTLSEFAR